MAESVVLVAENRKGRGSRAAHKLRAKGKVPGVIYGHKKETISVSLKGEDLLKAIHRKARVLDLEMAEGLQKVLIRELQWDHLGKELLHIDFARVSADERIHVSVSIELRGVSPGVVAGGLLEQPLHVLHVECLAIAVPESIRVVIADLQIEGVIHVRELVLPEGVKALDDPESIVVQVKPPQAEAEAAAGETAEPEIIGRKVGEEEAEGEAKK
jgi:large subunit ribosomal protein L25